MGRIGFVDLTTGETREERLDEGLERQFIGGYGLGVRILFERQPKGADPLGPDNVLGFTTGPLTGTKTPTGGRYMAVCKSPLTGGWGDANCGGYFGSQLKAAGWDALFVSGIASVPQCLVVSEDGLLLKEASHLWGKDAVETEEMVIQELGGSGVRVATIGTASERLSLITGIMTDKGRAAARSGVGAVMGAKRLKAVAVAGKGKVPVADPKALDELRKAFVKNLKDAKGFPAMLRNSGTCGLTGGLVPGGATPVKNWRLAGEQAFPGLANVADTDKILQYQVKKYGCANCPIVCGGIYDVPKGPYPVGEVHKPEYETIAAFGPLCLNEDFAAIIKLNDMCNRSGLDTISAGNVLAFVMELYEKGIISKGDTDGIEMTWGNAAGMIAMLDKIIAREGLGDILADGVKVAAGKIGSGADECAMHVGGQEPGFHSALFLPSRGTGFVCDPTPGRHTAAPMARLDAGAGSIAPYPELQFKDIERYEYKTKGPASATASSYLQVGTSAGVCLFPLIFFGDFPLIEFLNAVTGWDMGVDEVLETGARVQTLRQCFNIREGVKPSDVKLPPRMAGNPPQSEGPVAGVTIDIESLVREYNKAMGWDAASGHPETTTLERLGLKKLTEDCG
jgi:aldehyde:ferredoxin oxidoreductase